MARRSWLCIRCHRYSVADILKSYVGINMEIAGFIFLYFVLGFITAVFIHKSGDWNPVEIESSYDAVFITLVWPLFWFVWALMAVLWPFVKLYEKLFGL